MTDDESPDLEPIDLAGESRAAGAPSGFPGAMPQASVATGAWTPGWYADPWTAGQYRYWSGQAWTGETNRWGPANAGSAQAAGSLDPWASASTRPAGGYAPPFGATSAGGDSLAPEPRRGRGPLVAGLAALVAAVLISGSIGFAIESHSHSKASAQIPSTSPLTPFIPSPSSSGGTATTAPPTTVPRSAISRDPDRHSLASIVVRQTDVAPSHKVLLIPSGNLLDQPTLDLCNGTYPSERLRTARLQVADVDANVNAALSTEAVLYRNAAATAQAFAELRTVSAACPHRVVPSPVGEGPSETVFAPAPDSSWPRTATVERQAYSFTSTTPASASAPASTSPSVAVYLRRGRALLGLYFSNPKGAQSPVAGQRTIEGIVGVFEARLAALPAAVVNGG
jgi:hypothetical protein